MPFLLGHLARKNPARSKHGWIRLSTTDSDTSLTVPTHLCSCDEGCGANSDAGDFITWPE
ncbi:hypothetical protein ABZ896_15365 [Streptomyces sp. NPDC047072]|uniref:hypothetical protein n=1 Tax=Streptomyces sp. NPDC047072 TaxID=3154809 RepID=UPI0033DE7DF9